MSYLPKLSTIDVLDAADKLAVDDKSSGDWRAVSIDALREYMQGALVFSGTEFTKQYSSPSLSGTNIALLEGSANVWLILTPTAGLAALTLTLPASVTAVDMQEVMVNCTQQITALTVNLNGATAQNGAPSSLGADDFFKMKYDAATKTWNRIG
jgi:hypothetical protein